MLAERASHPKYCDYCDITAKQYHLINIKYTSNINTCTLAMTNLPTPMLSDMQPACIGMPAVSRSLHFNAAQYNYDREAKQLQSQLRGIFHSACQWNMINPFTMPFKQWFHRSEKREKLTTSSAAAHCKT